MADPSTLAPAGDHDADELEAALRKAAQPKTKEPDIATSDDGASAAAEETAKP